MRRENWENACLVRMERREENGGVRQFYPRVHQNSIFPNWEENSSENEGYVLDKIAKPKA